LPFELLPVILLSVSCAFAISYAGILPIAKVLKRDSGIIRFTLQAQQNDERSAKRSGIED
jgi:hypothetical protein